MEQPPDLNALREHMTGVCDQLTRIVNAPAINDGPGEVQQQLRQMQRQMQQMQQTQQEMQQEMQRQMQQMQQTQQEMQQQNQDFHQQLPVQLRNEFRQLLDDQTAQLRRQFSASEKNAMARESNARIINANADLAPLFTRDDVIAAGFPQRLGDLQRLTAGNLSALLMAYGQPVDGNVQAKRRRFKKFLGFDSDMGGR